MNPMTPTEICAMIIALCAPLLLALREFIITRQAAPDMTPDAAKTSRGWTRITWRDNAPWAGRILKAISRRALAACGGGGCARYSMPDEPRESDLIAVARKARALLAPEGAWLKNGYCEDAQGNKLRGGYDKGACRFCLDRGVGQSRRRSIPRPRGLACGFL